MKKKLLIVMILSFVCLTGAFAQESKFNAAIDYLYETNKTYGFTSDDIKSLKVNYEYSTEHNQVTHLYLVQTHSDIELHNGIINFNYLPNGEVLHVGNNGTSDLKSKVNTTKPTLKPEDAIQKVIDIIHIEKSYNPKLINKVSDYIYLFDKGTIAHVDIKVQLKYFLTKDNKARLAWDVELDQVEGENYWSIRVDAVDGKILDKKSFTAHCSFQNNPFIRTSVGECDEVPSATKNIEIVEKKTESSSAVAAASYRVFAWPTESPSHGPHVLVTDPADATASPFGWHDTNGAAGSEYTITRGNNVWAYTDWTGTNNTSNNEPNGGAGLIFDYPFSTTLEPDAQASTAMVNLFYVNNMMHDFAYIYGFNEVAGNFQAKNYNNLGLGNDFVKAEAQDNFKAAQPSLNNANFSTPIDGGSGRMQMFAWNTTANRSVTVTVPQDIAGDYDNGVTSDFGPALTNVPLVGQLVLAKDNTPTPTWACSPLINTDMTGKIAVIDRGSCNFSLKVWHAQQKGAIAAIICNFEDAIINMAGGLKAAEVTIPSVFMKNSDCNRIRAFITSGVTVSLQTKTVAGPVYLDGDFDNGIIAHEYGHGISTRLTGGPANSSCLGNEEEMGEGWGDIMSLITTVKASDTKTTARGVGTYAERQPVTGPGIRRYPYSTDFKVNPLTYDATLANPEVHAIGEIWAVTLWDLYWEMSDKYGWSANLKDVTSGNGKAIKLIFDGMKLQKCSPGFLDGRDAIIAADKANYAGANNCLIWDVFARRGMGYYASQGLSTSATDGKEDFSGNPFCTEKLKVEKVVTDIIDPGQDINVTIKVINHKKVAVNNITVTDEIPAGATFKAGSSNIAGTVSGSNLGFNIATVKSLDTIFVTYKLSTDPNKKSIASFYDGAEADDIAWSALNIKNTNIFSQTDLFKNKGVQSYGVSYPSGPATVSDQVLELANSRVIGGNKPTLGFFQFYNTEPGSDGGILQSTIDNFTWEDMGNQIFKNGYRGPLTYSTFAIPNQKGFWGKSADISNPIFKPTFVDLSSFKGKDFRFRFRFGCDSLIQDLGWFIDDIFLFDMVNYTGKVNVSAGATDTASYWPLERGTIVMPSTKVSTFSPSDGMKVNVYPNPTYDYINIEIANSTSKEVQISVNTIDGKQLNYKQHGLSGSGSALIPIDISTYPNGMYLVKIQTALGVVVEKVVKQ
jgi:extracellular elastinolytic metalloproteinase